MSDLYGDEFDSVAAGGGLLPDGLRRGLGAILFLALVAALGFWAYRLGSRDAAEVPIIRAMEGPARIAPADPGGAVAAHQGLEVNAVLAGEPAPDPAATPGAAPLAPAPSILAAEDGPQGELVVAAPSVLSDEALADGADLRMPADEASVETALYTPDEGAALLEPPAASGPIDTAALVAAALGARPPTAEAEEAAGLAATTPAADEGAARPLRRPASLPAARARTPVAAPAAAPAAREATGLSKGARLVQLGAYDSEGLTREAWNRLIARHGDLLGAKSLYVERTTANARVFYRLRVAGFSSPAETRAMCEALRARGVDCIPVTLQ